MCQHLAVSTSGYYEWCTRALSQRSIQDRIMTEQIRQIHTMSDRTYGRDRVQAELSDMGLCVNHKRIARLAIFAWIASWYNPLRRHSGLGQRSANIFERCLQTQKSVAHIIEADDPVREGQSVR